MAALVIAAAVLLLLTPGALLHLLFRQRGWSLPTCLGLGLTALIVLFADSAAMVGYHLWLIFTLNVGLIAMSAAAIIRYRPREAATRHQLPAPRNPHLTWRPLAWVMLAVVFIAPAFVVPVPFDTDAQGFGLLALTARESGSINSLAPFHPEVGYVYSPAYPVFVAYFSDLTGAPIHQVMLGFSHLIGFLVVVLAFGLGREIGGPRFGWLNALATALTAGLFTSLMDSAYPTILGLAVTEVVLTMLIRAARTSDRRDWIAAGISLAALPLSHPDSIIHLLLAYLPMYLTVWLARPRIDRAVGARLLIVVPLIGVALILPWAARELPLVSGIDVHERQSPQWYHGLAMFTLNGWLTPLAAIPGLALAARRRALSDVWMLTWLPPILLLSSTPWLDSLSKATSIDPLQILYPFGIAWHATIIPFAYFAALAAESLVLRLEGRWDTLWERLRAPVFGSGLALSLAGVALARPIIQATKPYVSITGALASPADLRAFEWLRENTPPDARLLNYPGRIEGQWAPVIAERDSVYIRDQLFYVGAGAIRAEQASLASAYFDPDSAAAYTAMRAAGIDYVVVPQAAARPDLFPTMMRWRAPWTQPQLSDFSAAPYLELVADFDGAQVWRLVTDH